MKTILLPGYSKRNKEWAEEMKRQLAVGGRQLVTHEWKHWDEDVSMSLGDELHEVLGKIKDEKVNILAKSVGTRVAMVLLEKIPEQINKLILCGIPTVEEDAKTLYSPLEKMNPGKTVVFQNLNDPLASFSEVKELVQSISPKIEVIEKDRSDHSYPYPEDFINFLKD